MFETPKRTRSSELLTLISFRKLFRFRACNETSNARILGEPGPNRVQRKREKGRASPIYLSVSFSMLLPPTIHSVNVFENSSSKNVYLQHTRVSFHRCHRSCFVAFRIVIRLPDISNAPRNAVRKMERQRIENAGWKDGWMEQERGSRSTALSKTLTKTSV